LLPGLMVFLAFLFISNTNWAGVEKYDRSRNYVRAGIYYFERGEFPKSLQNFVTAIKLNADSVEAYNGIGSIALKQGKPKEGLMLFLQAELKEPENAQVQYNLGLAYEMLGNWEEAGRRFERALEIYPDYEKAKEQLKWLDTQKNR